jgi:hypothetical protein
MKDTSMFREIELGIKGVEHVRTQLGLGGSLAARISTAPLEQGVVGTRVPITALKDGEIADLQSGGVMNREDSVTGLGKLISGFLRQSMPPRRYAVFAEPFGKRGDSYLTTVRERKHFMGDEVFFSLLHEDADTSRVLDTIRRVGDYPFIGVLSSIPNDGIGLEHGEELDEDMLEALVSGMDHLVVGAFDGEGFVIWSTNELMARRAARL